MNRSKWKLPFNPLEIKPNNYLKTRNLEINEKSINEKENTFIYVHTGNTFIKLKLSSNLINHKLGEFILTKKKKKKKKKKGKKKKK